MNRQSQESDESLAETVIEYAQKGLQSNVVTGVVGGLVLLQGVRQLRRGRWRGIFTLLVGSAFVGITALRAQSSSDVGLDQTDVVDTAPDIEDVTSGTDPDAEQHATGDEAASVVDTGPDVEDAGSSPEIDPDDDASVDQSDVVDTGPSAADEESETAE